MDKEEMKKLWYRSKTIVFNLIVATFTGLGTIIHEEAFAEMLKEHYGSVLAIVTIGNVFLRMVTTQPVTFKGERNA